LTSTATLNHSCIYRMWQRCPKNRTRVWAYVSGFVILADSHIRTAVTGNYFSERKTVWMDVWGLNPEKVGSHGIMTSAFWGGGFSFVWKFPWWGWSGPCPYAKHTLAFSLQLRKIAGSLGFIDLFFYSWGTQIESRPRHRLSWLWSRYFPQSLEDKAGTVLYL
jgi:hypothetical protein